MPDEIVPPVVPPVVDPAPAWHAALSPEAQAYVTANGLAEKTALDAFSVTAQAHQRAQALIGIPKDQLLRMPSAERPDEAKAFWQKLGAPADAAGYDFTGVKTAAAADPDPALVQSLREAAAANFLPAPAAKAVAEAVVKYQDATAATALAATQAALKTQQDALRANWGQNYDANLGIADRAAKALGVDVETAALLSEKVGADKVLEMFRKIGSKMGEDTFVNPGPLGGDVPPAANEAKARLDMLKADPEWGKRFLAGGAAENAEYQKLFAAANPALMAAANAA